MILSILRKAASLPFFLFCSFLLGFFLFLFEYEWVDLSRIHRFVSARPSVVLDDAGNELFRFELDHREPVPYEKIPRVLINAFLAAEDHKFFSHSGISIKGIIRSTIINCLKRRIVQGASTITQQVARGVFLSNRQTMGRKIREAFVAFQLERRFTKEQIFELYVNTIYFGRGTYGVEAACQRFWNKSVSEISIDEAATLAAVAKSARLYSPLNAPESAKRRRNIILYSMFKLGFISEEECRVGREKEMEIQDCISGDAVKLYIQERVRMWAEKKWGKEVLYQKGLKIKTTINSRRQNLAEKLFCKKVEMLREKVGDSLNGGMISIEPRTGKIKVCIGGYDFRESQFNRAFQAVRQMGSSFKPIVYTAAMLDGIEMDTVMIDEPLEMPMPGRDEPWAPKNWTRKFEGAMTLAKALSRSNNIVTIKALLKIGSQKVIDLAKMFGIHRSLSPYPSLALGVAEATVKESVAAFNVFANNGVYVEPYLIEWVKDRYGKKLWEHKRFSKRVLDVKTNSKMVNALSFQLKKLQERLGYKYWIDAEVVGKTGSTNGASTTWYVGATPELTTSVYIGRDDNKPMGRYVFGIHTAYPIWFEFYKKLAFSNKQFYRDPSLREVEIDWTSGHRSYSKEKYNTVVLLK
jgi:penicillin-binding protein 1A